MEEIKKEEVKIPQKKPGQWKNKLIGILVLIVIIEGVVFWFWLQASREKIQEAKEVVDKIEMLDQERERCSGVLTQPVGEFADYEYCKRLLQKFPKGD